MGGISRLTSDYLNSTGVISTHDVFEGMALFRHANGTYYMMTSHLTGWDPNPLMLFRAQGTSLDDPQWINMGNPTGDHTSFNSQPTYVVQYTPANGQPYFVYMGDNWVHCPNEDGTEGPLINACYMWLPIHFHDSSITMEYNGAWDLDNPFAPAPPSGVTCIPSQAVTQGLPVQLAPCDSSASQSWKYSGTTEHSDSLSMADLCLDVTGRGIVTECSDGADQKFAVAGQQLKRDFDSECLDVTWCGSSVCNGMALGSYSCNTVHPYQLFDFDATSGQLRSNASGQALCVTVCEDSFAQPATLVVV